MSSIRKNPACANSDQFKTARRRLPAAAREQMIVDGAVKFFSEHGLGGQLRDLARGLGITHTLMYHYFPTKQALIERVYADLFEGRWRPEWQLLLDDPKLDAHTKLTRFYCEYAKVILERDWVRVFVFSGLSDRYITDRYFALLGEKLFPRLVRESRRHQGIAIGNEQPSDREMEAIMGLHGSIFYMGVRRWVYGHVKNDPLMDRTSAITQQAFDQEVIADRVRSYLTSLEPSSPSHVQLTENHTPLSISALPTVKELNSWPFH
jgi:AcrR family transcriptional regulator